MKEKILKFFKTDRSFKVAVALYNEFGNKMSFKRQLNAQPETPLMKNTLFEELRQLAGISSSELKAILSNDVKITSAIAVEKAKTPEDKKKDIVAQIMGIPEGIKKAVNLRSEFPFLKDADCPNELKILVADMLTCYYNYCAAHENLFTAENEDKLLEASLSCVDNYLENRDIWDELNHYKENKEILGKHPLFEKMSLILEIKSKTTDELYKRKASLEKMILKVKKQIKDNDKPKLLQERQDSLNDKEFELNEILKILNIKK